MRYQRLQAILLARAVAMCLIGCCSTPLTCSSQEGAAACRRDLGGGGSSPCVTRLPTVCADDSADHRIASRTFSQWQPLHPTSDEHGVGPGPQLGRWLKERARTIRADHANYYGRRSLCDLAIGIALAAPLANTAMDHNFRNWWQDDARSSGTDDLAAFWKPFGEGSIFIPAMACLGLVGHAMSDWPLFDVCGEFGERAARGYLVGAPPMLLMQTMLGASRPGETTAKSRWKPFDDNNAVSGHAFIGAVPFITAAHMTENRAARALLYLGSTCPAWSRVNDDAHYLSQVILGWYMAYLACRAVEGTQQGEEPLSLVPLACYEFTGIGLVWRR